MENMRRLFLTLSLVLPVTLLAGSAAWAQTKIEATIFSYDDGDFVRTVTTLMEKGEMAEEGESAVETKLNRDSAAYKALAEKRSYSGPATLFGKDYEAHYAPLIGDDGNLTGAIFVGVPK